MGARSALARRLRRAWVVVGAGRPLDAEANASVPRIMLDVLA
jgi:hypothetical protein